MLYNDITAFADFDERKFTEYIFHPDILINLGKKDLFESWGYSIINTTQLIQDYKQQAVEKYVRGEYLLGKLDDFGQRITILINLENGDHTHSFLTGWMVYPYGRIENATPMASSKSKKIKKFMEDL